MDTLFDRLKSRRKEAGLTQLQLAKLVGVSHVTISQWERGDTTPRGNNLHQLAKSLGCTAEWLLYGQSNISEPTQVNIFKGPEIKGHFPLISWVNAGNWQQIDEINPKEAKHYPCPVNCSEETFVLRVQGISMEPIFHDGDLIFVDPKIEWRHGSYVVARLDDQNEATFKQLIIEGGHKYLKPLNPNWPEQIIPINGNCTIVGVVVFSGRAFS